MLQRFKQRRAAKRELMAKLENLTDPTLIHRMYRPLKMRRNYIRLRAAVRLQLKDNTTLSERDIDKLIRKVL